MLIAILNRTNVIFNNIWSIYDLGATKFKDNVLGLNWKIGYAKFSFGCIIHSINVLKANVFWRPLVKVSQHKKIDKSTMQVGLDVTVSNTARGDKEELSQKIAKSNVGKTKVTFSGFHLRINSQKLLQRMFDLTAEDTRPQYYEISAKDKSLIRLLFAMSLVFFATNIPMAIGRIIESFDISTDEPYFKEFTIVANVLEIIFAASNFYLYCFCNYHFRKNVSKKM